MDLPTREIVINSLLCFTINSIGKYPVKVVKSLISDFYDMDTVKIAKERLLSDIAKANINVKIPKRRATENKLKLEIEDIISALQIVDQAGDNEKLPRYATDNFNEIPIVKMDSSGLSIIFSKLEDINNKVDRLQGNCHFPQIQFNQPAGPSSSIRRRTAEIDEDADNHVNWGDMSQDSEIFEDVVSKKKKRRKNLINNGETPVDTTRLTSGNVPVTATPRNNNANSYATALSKNVNAKPQSTNGPNSVGQPSAQKPKRFIGRANNIQGTTKLEAAKPYVKKAIFALYNVSNTASVDTVSSFVAQICGATPINCFEISRKSKQSARNTAEDAAEGMVEGTSEGTAEIIAEGVDDNPKAFRVCIDDKYTQHFVNQNAWMNGIVVKPWKFKPKDDLAGNQTRIKNGIH